MATDVTVVVPWRPGCPHRAAAWEYVRPRWAVHELVTADAPGDFNRAPAIVAGAQQAHGQVLVIVDADVFLEDNANEALAAVRDGAPWAVPHGLVHRLDETTTSRLLSGDRNVPVTYDQKPYRGHPAGGIVVIHRDVLEQVPPDRRFAGWGQEDDAWAAALLTLAGPPWRGDAALWHLWHPHPVRRTRRVGNRAGEQLFRQYKAARGNPSRMRQLVDAGR